jgi:hypothetical protein
MAVGAGVAVVAIKTSESPSTFKGQPKQESGADRLGRPATLPFFLNLLNPSVRKPLFKMMSDGSLHGRLRFEQRLIFPVLRLLDDLVHRRRATAQVVRYDFVKAKLLPIAQI